MRLPNGGAAIVPAAKVRDYLLAEDHPVGGGKARVFLRAGYQATGWLRLLNALKTVAETGEVVSTQSGRFGDRFVVAGEIPAGRGRTLRVLTVWIIPTGENAPRLITAYPRRDR